MALNNTYRNLLLLHYQQDYFLSCTNSLRLLV